MLFNYYKRGVGELDTSNFPEIYEAKEVTLYNLDNRALVSLWALNTYIQQKDPKHKVTVHVTNYVQHLRGDKDVFPVAQLYEQLNNLDFKIMSIQHESTNKIHSPKITKEYIANYFGLLTETSYYTVGADKSVPKFLDGTDACAEKVRKNSKVTKIEIDTSFVKANLPIIIVDDILGGGATIQMLVNKLRDKGVKNDLYLWVKYNEGIHTRVLLNHFKAAFLGDKI